jgi:hypothetical protein
LLSNICGYESLPYSDDQCQLRPYSDSAAVNKVAMHGRENTALLQRHHGQSAVFFIQSLSIIRSPDSSDQVTIVRKFGKNTRRAMYRANSDGAPLATSGAAFPPRLHADQEDDGPHCRHRRNGHGGGVRDTVACRKRTRSRSRRKMLRRRATR